MNGKESAQALRASIGDHVDALIRDHGVQPGLAVILVGNDPASEIYVRNKRKAAEKAGIRSTVHTLPADTQQDKVIKMIEAFNVDKDVHGILVQMPLPAHIDTQVVLQTVDPAKDVDGLHAVNAGFLSTGQTGMIPCTPMGCLFLIKSVLPKLDGLHAVVVGRSNLVGKPVAQLLLRENCTVTTVHSRTLDPAHIARQADILVVAAGCAKMVKADWVKPGAVIIDVGITRMDDGSLSGDVDFDLVEKIAGHITPVPGGVGPMTIACLLGNTVIAACRQNGIDVPHIG